jgi:tetraacyldisaccharide 4'-kinase
LNQGNYCKLISGQTSGLAAALLRCFLRATSWYYLTGIVLRNFLYSKGWLKAHQVNATVISVGNITAGGTGKTPLVIWLYNQITQNPELKTKNYICAILTRGYKTTQNYIDEPAILTANCPQAKVIINPNRADGAAEAIDKFGAQVLIMDDGFQHRRLARDLDIVAIDATRPFGYGKVLPAGLLREPVAALKRADAVVITRCDQISESELTALEEKLRSANPNMLIAKSIHRPICAKSLGRKEIHLEELRNKNIFAFCGIANPDAFLNTIKDLGLNLVGSKFYNDHHHYTDDCLADIYEEAGYLSADLILTTQKDWTKTALPARTKDIFFAYLVIELKLLVGEDKLRGLIQDALADKIPQK